MHAISEREMGKREEGRDEENVLLKFSENCVTPQIMTASSMMAVPQ